MLLEQLDELARHAGDDLLRNAQITQRFDHQELVGRSLDVAAAFHARLDEGLGAAQRAAQVRTGGCGRRRAGKARRLQLVAQQAELAHEVDLAHLEFVVGLLQGGQLTGDVAACARSWYRGGRGSRATLQRIELALQVGLLGLQLEEHLGRAPFRGLAGPLEVLAQLAVLGLQLEEEVRGRGGRFGFLGGRVLEVLAESPDGLLELGAVALELGDTAGENLFGRFELGRARLALQLGHAPVQLIIALLDLGHRIAGQPCLEVGRTLDVAGLDLLLEAADPLLQIRVRRAQADDDGERFGVTDGPFGRRLQLAHACGQRGAAEAFLVELLAHLLDRGQVVRALRDVLDLDAGVPVLGAELDAGVLEQAGLAQLLATDEGAVARSLVDRDQSREHAHVTLADLRLLDDHVARGRSTDDGLVLVDLDVHDVMVRLDDSDLEHGVLSSPTRAMFGPPRAHPPRQVGRSGVCYRSCPLRAGTKRRIEQV